ncbi:PaaX family transcriptional regulator C-terminal domain-containing protein [Stenotrophobium rhamnosiphilum]|uniref:PaaX family transcriptional regulator n=1 Tax=Stenotrophobium rhamnosiphilum TaxID=2029166 RepID=A0A2T5MIL1_9GAMM|nr:PaaX family transcriptional regulator C-terminal domain-containing protein [Stenotrophobium rhamnosiphilum]PTU32394.1 PaaX family transcriptional regulator [Stenotrophobium rhamnosiphilum]
MKPNPRHVVLNLLLAANDETLSAREAIGACGLLGIRENSVRVALLRLAAAGMIESTGRGSYQLGPNASGLAGEISNWRDAEKRVKEWKGGWIAVHTASLGRSDRSALRGRDRALQLLGMRELDRGLYVRPDNLAGGVVSVRERLHKLGLDNDAVVFVAHEFDDEREQRARKLWNGKALSKSYRDTRLKLESWLARADQLDPEAAARESFLLGDKAIHQLVFDPLLPEPLVDVKERRAFVEAVVRYDRAGHAIWQRLHFNFSNAVSAGAKATRPH